MAIKFNPFTGDFDLIGSTTASNSFTIIQPDHGTSPTAATSSDTLSLTSSDGSIVITGNSSTDTIDFKLSGSTPPGDISLTNSHILVGNASNKAADVALTGDVSITNTGVSSVSGATFSVTVNSSLTGSNVRVTPISTTCIRLTNNSLSSIGSVDITGVTNGKLIILSNDTNNNITIIDTYISAAAGEAIATGFGSNLILTNQSSVALIYDSTNSIWTLLRDGKPSGSGYALYGTNVPTADQGTPGDVYLRNQTTFWTVYSKTGSGTQVPTPTMLALDIDPNSITLTDGSGVSAYTDNSGNSRNFVQASGGNQPIYKTGILNGFPIFRFSGNQWLDASSYTFDSSKTYSLYFICSQTTGTAGGIIGNNSSGADIITYLDFVTGTQYLHTFPGDANITTGITSNSFAEYEIIFNVTSSGSGTCTAGVNDTGYVTVSSSARTPSATPLRIGAFTNSTTKLTGDIARILLYEGSHTTGQRTTVYNYLYDLYFGSGGTGWTNENGMPALSSGLTPISVGGTNSGTSLNNNRVMKSSGGAIVEAAAITANRALISDSNGIPTQSATTNTELSYVSGVTSAIQTQLSNLNAFESIYFFGDGSDGALTISSGTTTLTRDMYYTNVTISGTAILKPAGWKVFINGTLDISAAPAGGIQSNGVVGGNGGNTGTAGAIGSAANNANTLGVAAATAGAAGGTGAGAQAAANASVVGFGGIAGSSGAGGSGSGGGAGGGRTAASSAVYTPRRLIVEAIRGATLMNGGAGGPGGGSGGGDGSNNGAGGGAGGQAGGPIFIICNTLATGTNSTAAVIQAMGFAGGNGGSTAAGNTGGAGGGGGGGGGSVYLAYANRTGSTITNGIDVSAGAGGNGGTKTGTGTNGAGAASGAGGGSVIINILTQTVTTFSGGSSNAASGTTGGAAVTAQTNL